MSNEINLHMHIPANPFCPIAVGNWVTLERKYQILNCDLIEYIYPMKVHPYLRWAGDEHFETTQYQSWVMIGDEEARLRYDPIPNYRATQLFGYPYPICGDVLLLCEDGTNLEKPLDMTGIAMDLQSRPWVEVQ